MNDMHLTKIIKLEKKTILENNYIYFIILKSFIFGKKDEISILFGKEYNINL